MSSISAHIAAPRVGADGLHPRSVDDFRWHSPGEPEGRGWQGSATHRITDRLPAWAEETFPALVWKLSRHSSGLFYRFRTDATALAARWTLPDEPIAMPHMSAVSVSGVDLYAKDDHGQLRFAASGMPAAAGEQVSLLLDAVLPSADGLREYRLYLPNYNRADNVAVGVEHGAAFGFLPADQSPPVAYYGSSIVQGAAASRPGMSVPAMLGRWLDRTVINLGMSGSAKMEVELADLLADVDAALYVVDALPNMSPEQVAERAEPFIRRLRKGRDDVPVLLVEDRARDDAWLRAGLAETHSEKGAALRRAYRTLAEEGDTHLYYLGHSGLFGWDGEGTVDGKHPTDLGAHRMTRRLESTIRSLLQKYETSPSS
jgi:lysophospholipase L1-like esterase